MRLSTISTRARVFLGVPLTLLLLLSMLLCGCGGGSPVGKKTGKGAAVFTIAWPRVQKSTRLIPAASNFIRIQITQPGNTFSVRQDAMRPYPPAGTTNLTPPVTTLTFNNLPPGQYSATATAYPNSPDIIVNNTPQATATVPLAITDGQTTQSNLTMGTTITQALPSAIPPNSIQTTGRFTPFSLTPTARDNAGNMVLVGSLQVTVSDSSIASVSGSGTFAISNAGKLGTVTVTVTEPESGVTQSFLLTFLPAIYISDRDNHRLVRMDDMLGTNFTAYQNVGSGTGQIQTPRQLAIDGQNRIYVADNDSNRIVRMDNISGTNFTTYGILGSTAGQLRNPYGVAIDPQNHIYIGDTSNSRMVRIDDFTGINFQTFGSGGSMSGQFHDPVDVALDSRNRIYIADYANNRIVRIDNITGANFTSYDASGSGRGQFNAPFGVAVDAQDRIYIGDSSNNRIVRIDDMNGTNFTSYDASGSGTVRLNNPVGIAFDAQNRIYIADLINNRIVRIDDMTGTGFIAFGSGQFNRPEYIAVH